MEPDSCKTTFDSFGVQCGEGWRGLYQPLLDLCKLRGIRVLQVKEKFGGLRFYTGAYEAGDSDLTMLIDAAEDYSFKVCEDCGKYGYTYDFDKHENIPKVTTGSSRTSGWIRSLCAGCREKLDLRREAEVVDFKRRQEERKAKDGA